VGFVKSILPFRRSDQKLSFRSIKFETEPYEIIVLDDLSGSGYVLNDRKVGIDLEHAKLVLCKLAKFHAASAIQYEKVRS
jgi:thiamine kinase-like enzyme